MPMILFGILIPLIGTTAGAFCVLFANQNVMINNETVVSGFAGGVMTAASVWSLLLPAIEGSGALGKFAFLPPAVGIWCGVLFLIKLGKLLQRVETRAGENIAEVRRRARMMTLSVVLHNVPEGMAVGAAFSGRLLGADMSTTAATALAVGIAIQNFPEGAIISMPAYASGKGKAKAVLYGFLSGVVEPAAAVLTLALSSVVQPLLPVLLGFAAGAMLWVVIRDLTPDKQSDRSALAFCAGFSVMMILDVAFG